MATLEQLKRERDRARNRREAQVEQAEIQRKRFRLKKEIKELTQPKRTAFKKGFFRGAKISRKIVGRGLLTGGKGALSFAERVTRPTPAQIAAHKKKIRRRR
ncbi:MAG: hypothetical protein KAQ92_07425 [Candidatus Aenigmarchaeota archaeon]|nr:hypothetical protein [Candidatus Aenigmarchaeota archaeon]